MIARPLFDSLQNAVRAAILEGNSISDINPMKWSMTYGNCGVEHVRTVWERIQCQMTMLPNNSFDTEGK
jgi:hypothetical protein